VNVPDRFLIDDGMILAPQPPEKANSVEILRGPNIGAPPRNEALPESLSAVVTIKLGDKITTDHIIPAGERMKYRSNISVYARYVFEVVDAGFAERAMTIKDLGRFNVIVAGLSYGQGSSREHAALCPMYLGVKAVIARSFERIHAANLINVGILPLVFARDTDYDLLRQGDRIELPDVRTRIAQGAPLVVQDRAQGFSLEVLCDLTPRQKQMILAGGALNVKATQISDCNLS
jgi:aconitate hydratase